MTKICFVTAARSEYGLLKWIMKEIDASECFRLQIIVTGGHLLESQGYTVDQIKADGFTINAEVDIQMDVSTEESIAASMGRMAEKLAHVFADLKPNYVVMLGDRYELLPICNTAYVMNIPIIHISGGDETEGAIDDGIRNAITMLASYHFPGTSDSEKNIRRMRRNNKNIWAVGEPGLDSFNKEQMMSRGQLATRLGLNMEWDWALMTYHPETMMSVDYNLQVVKNCCEVLKNESSLHVIATYSNADYGSSQINEYLEHVCDKNKMVVIPSLGNRVYLSMMKQVRFMIGNSSSGIIEAPMIGIPAINIGNRQKGRHQCNNVIQTGGSKEELTQAVKQARSRLTMLKDSYWGDGHTAERIVKILKKQFCGEASNCYEINE